MSRKVSNRRGTFLIELIVTIGISTLMLGTTISILHLVLRADRNAKNTLRHQVSISRLSDLFRQDVHAALQARLSGAGREHPRLELIAASPGVRISYEVDGATLIRARNSQPVADAAPVPPEQVEHRDRLHFPPGSVITIVPGAVGERSTARPAEAAVQSQAGPGDTLRIVIALPHGAAFNAKGRKSLPTPARPQAASPGRTLAFVAIVGRDHRFERLEAAPAPDQPGSK